MRDLLLTAAVHALRAVDTAALALLAALEGAAAEDTPDPEPTATIHAPCGEQTVPVAAITVHGTPRLAMVASWDCPDCGRHSIQITPPTAADLVADGARWVACPAEAAEPRPGGARFTEQDAARFAFDLHGVDHVAAIAKAGGQR